jgi:hypothetical protein
MTGSMDPIRVKPDNFFDKSVRLLSDAFEPPGKNQIWFLTTSNSGVGKLC